MREEARRNDLNVPVFEERYRVLDDVGDEVVGSRETERALRNLDIASQGAVLA